MLSCSPSFVRGCGLPLDRELSEAMQSTTTLMRGGTAVHCPPVNPVSFRGRTFAEGTVVSGRYRVERFIASGGMGEVYAAKDLSLHESVALKTIRPELASKPEALLRFVRELRLARRVTHANVCRVFDIGEHDLEPEVAGGPSRVVFLTMELLAGETLHAWLQRQGRMSPERVLFLAEQMAAALDAAHAARIVHRDFKSSNVMLVPAPCVPGGLRAVVTDFGLAHGELLEMEGATVGENHLVGSPPYMSPEQVEGRPLSPASDLYSFGVVLFEMVTGRLPFVGDSPMATALVRLHAPPPSVRQLVPELPLSWEDVVQRCLARQPFVRYESVSEAVAALRGGVQVPVARPSLQPVESPRSLLEPKPLVARRVVAVLAPRNLVARAETAWLSTALAELLSAELAVGEQMRLLPGEGVARMRQELALSEEEGFASGTLRRMRAHSGVDLVPTGTYLVQGREESARLRERLGLGPLTTEQVHGLRSAMPGGTEVARLYAEGLAALRGHDAATAVERFQRVVEWEPAFAPAHSALAAAFQYLFQEEAAKESARRAFELAGSLSREERLLVSARHYEAQAQWPRAIEAYQTLFEFFPDNVEYGTALVYAQVTAGQNREAQATLEALRRLPGPLGKDARIDLAAAVATCAAGDFTSSRQQAEAAVSRARWVGQGLLAASARIIEAYAVRNHGEPPAGRGVAGGVGAVVPGGRGPGRRGARDAGARHGTHRHGSAEGGGARPALRHPGGPGDSGGLARGGAHPERQWLELPSRQPRRGPAACPRGAGAVPRAGAALR